MTPASLLSELRRRRIRLECRGADLRYVAPRGAFTPELRAQAVELKPALVALLRVPGPAAPELAPPRRPGHCKGCDGPLLGYREPIGYCAECIEQGRDLPSDPF